LEVLRSAGLQLHFWLAQFPVLTLPLSLLYHYWLLGIAYLINLKTSLENTDFT